jgi:hypothetical protein
LGTSVYIDGFNLYYCTVRYTPYKWLDLLRLCTNLFPTKTIDKIKYFSTKVTRDRIMEEFDQIYPGYGFAQHKGYGTGRHMSCLQKLGPSPIHRLYFAPVRNVIASQSSGPLSSGQLVSTTSLFSLTRVDTDEPIH